MKYVAELPENGAGWWVIADAETGFEVGSGDGGFSETEAKLFAASPELLEAVKYLLDGGDITAEGIAKCRAAIAKAES
jgi:hypothetical protein